MDTVHEDDVTVLRLFRRSESEGDPSSERTALSFLGESQDADEIVVGDIRVGAVLKITGMRFVNLFKCCIFHSHLSTNVGTC